MSQDSAVVANRDISFRLRYSVSRSIPKIFAAFDMFPFVKARTRAI